MTGHRWAIQRQEGETFCEDEHPMRLGRNPEHYPGEPWQRTEAIRDGKNGYRCPGGEVHLYPIWIVYDAADERAPNAGAFDVYKEALECRDRMTENADELAKHVEMEESVDWPIQTEEPADA